MLQYGHIIDDSFNPINDNIYNTISSYFKNPELAKIKDANGYSVYMAKVKCLLAKNKRYIVAIVPQDFQRIDIKMRLNELKWKSFQTRTLDDMESVLPLVIYEPSNRELYGSRINMIDRNEKHTMYSCDNFNINISLLHKEKGIYEYQPTGTLCNALETYNTILTIQ